MEEYSPYNEKNISPSAQDIYVILCKCGITEYKVKNVSVFRKAFTHSTYVKRDTYTTLDGKPAKLAPCPPDTLDLQPESYEDIEFVGDGMLNGIVGYYLFRRYSPTTPGFLTNARKLIVRNKTLGSLALTKLGLDRFFIISKNVEEMKPEYGRKNIEKLGDILEAFLAALYIDSGGDYGLVARFVVNMIETYIDMGKLLREDDNYKDRMQRHCQHEYQFTPIYKMVNTDEKKGEFTMAVCKPSGEELGRGCSTTKKQAEQNACREALKKFNVLI